MPGERVKIQATAQRDPRPLTTAPSGRRGVRAGREREPRTAKHPAIAIHTRALTHSACIECWKLGKQDSKTCEWVMQPEPLGQRKASAFCKS